MIYFFSLFLAVNLCSWNCSMEWREALFVVMLRPPWSKLILLKIGHYCCRALACLSNIQPFHLFQNSKRIYYLSLEYLVGRSLLNAILNLQMKVLLNHGLCLGLLDWDWSFCTSWFPQVTCLFPTFSSFIFSFTNSFSNVRNLAEWRSCYAGWVFWGFEDSGLPPWRNGEISCISASSLFFC